MEAHELMIGNYVYLYGNIAQIQRSDFHPDFNGIAIDKGKPIPLTEQWLINFGFEIIQTGYVKTGEYYSYYIDNDLLFWIGDNNRYEILFVHHLQNLYFTLTGKQLKKQ